MRTDLFYTTGQAARELDTSPAALRSLCSSGAIDHKTTEGGQYRISKAVLEQLKRDGLPSVPRPLPDEGGSRPPKKNAGREQQLAPPSNAVAESADAAMMSGHHLQVARNQVELLRAKKEATERNANASEWPRQPPNGSDESRPRPHGSARSGPTDGSITLCAPCPGMPRRRPGWTCAGLWKKPSRRSPHLSPVIHLPSRRRHRESARALEAQQGSRKGHRGSATIRPEVQIGVRRTEAPRDPGGPPRDR
ncbi:MAG: helix-turn-helix domain-containing protein [Acidobacteria bacterium]|nr:helix-turn-helix domain-containing protein [Acidobacteriota bacterium]